MKRALLYFLLFSVACVFAQAEQQANNTEELPIQESVQSDQPVDPGLIMKILPKSMQQATLKMAKENPLSLVSKDEIRAMISVRLEGQSLGTYLKKNPKYLEMLVELLHDKRALPRFISIISKRDKTKMYGIGFLFLVALGFFLNLKNSTANLYKRAFIKFSLMLGTSIANIALFYIVFKDELTPGLSIIFKYIHL